MKRRTATTVANDKHSTEQVSNEQILNSLHQIYVNPDHGFLKIGRSLGLLDLYAPRRKINIMLIGNHSSGKSTFINWYVGQKVQKTGVAIETQGFSFVTCARQRETLTGAATLRVFPYLKPLEEIEGVVAYLNTELVPSQSRRFDLVTLIDTPGLADGELSYPYDIERAILWLGDKVDMIFVFFDPIGQALCKRTLSLVESFSRCCSEKMKFFLSKADEAGIEADRQKVMMQIVQELCKRSGLDQSGFEMLTIYIPDHSELKHRELMCTNQIDQVCQMIDKTIALTIQKNFEQTEVDLNQIEDLLDSTLKREITTAKDNVKKLLKLFFVIFLSLQLPLSVLIHQNGDFDRFVGRFTRIETHSNEFLIFPLLFVELLMKIYGVITHEMFYLQKLLPISSFFLAIFSFLAFTLPICFIARFIFQFDSTMKKNILNQFRNFKLSLIDARNKREYLFKTYLNQMLVESDSY